LAGGYGGYSRVTGIGVGGVIVSGGGIVGTTGGSGGGLGETYFSVQEAMWLEVVISWNGRKNPG
jgi:hypothetical protein